MNNRLFYYVVVLFVLTLITRIVLITFHNANYGGLDMNVIYGVQRILNGEPLYQDPNLPSYAIMQYSPLHYYASAGLAKLLGIGGSDVQQIYMATRSLALLCNLVTVLLAAGIFRLWDLPRRQVLIYSLPVLMIVTMEYYTRGDSMHFMFFVAAMYAALRYLHDRKAGWLAVAALMAGCSIMSKQSGVLSVGIIGFYLLFIAREYLRAVIFGIGSLLAAAIVARICTGGDWLAFYQNAYLGLKNGIGWDWLYTIFTSQFYYDLILCYVVGGIIGYYAFKHVSDAKYRFVATGAVLSFLFALITGLKIGSGNNYFTEFIFFVLCGLPGLLASDFGRRRFLSLGKYSITVRRFASIAFFVLISSKTLGLVSSIYIERWVRDKREVYQGQQRLFSYFTDSMGLRKGEYIYFSKREFLDNIFMGYSLLPTKDVTNQVYSSNPGTYDYKSLIAGLNNGVITYIVTPEGDSSINAKDEEVPFVRFSDSNFAWVRNVEGYSIYQFKKH